MGSTEGSGSKAAWIDEVAPALLELFPAVRAVVWFDHNDEALGDFRLATSDESFAAWARLTAAGREPVLEALPAAE